MDNREFSTLCARRWAMPVLAALSTGVTARVSPVAAALDKGRTSIGQTFDWLEAEGYLCRNPGHGHPLRPEYILTAKGAAVGACACTLEAALAQTPHHDTARKAWVLPSLRLLDQPRRFGELRGALSPVTDRALTLSLKSMVEVGWADRLVQTEASPPRVYYSAGRSTASLRSALALSWAA